MQHYPLHRGDTTGDAIKNISSLHKNSTSTSLQYPNDFSLRPHPLRPSPKGEGSYFFNLSAISK